MKYHLTRTSMALDEGTLRVLEELSDRWSVSKAEVMRRAVKQAKVEADRETQRPKPLEALDWLQSGAGLSVEEASAFKKEVQAERLAKRYWWQA